jgi:hypothetical protein
MYCTCLSLLANALLFVFYSSTIAAVCGVLAGVAQNLQAVHRSDLSSSGSAAGEVSIASTHQSITWVGEIAGLSRGMSSVILLLDKESNTVHGHVRFWDSDEQGFRAFKVSRAAPL